MEKKNKNPFVVRFGSDLSEGVPHEVFGPWVRWGRGQVISDLSQRRTGVAVGPKMDPNLQKAESFVF